MSKIQINEFVCTIRNLTKESLESMVYVMVPPGISGRGPIWDSLGNAVELWQASNGPMFGAIGFHDFENLETAQFRADQYPGNQKQWLSIANTGYKDILLMRDQDRIFIFDSDNPDEEPVDLGTFENFFNKYVRGQGYVEQMSGYEDEYFLWLKENGLLIS